MSGLLWSDPLLGERKSQLVLQERANQISHGIGAVLSTIAAIVLLRAASIHGDPCLLAGCWVYAVSLVMLYATSTLSHSFLSGSRKHIWRSADQVSIFLLIAGTYTPVGLTVCRHGWWWLVLGAMWSLALAGIAIKLFVKGIQNVPVWFYVAVGWMPMLAMGQTIAFFSGWGLFWIIAGGASYTIGTLFLTFDEQVRYFHAIWHVATIIGSAYHFVVIYGFLIPGM